MFARPTSILVLTLAAIQAGTELYEIAGRILQSDGKPFAQVVPVVFLDGAYKPFSTGTRADHRGEFRFKKIAPGTYNLIVKVPRTGEIRKTIEVGPSSADSRRRVVVSFRMERSPQSEQDHTVPVVRLAIPEQAVREYRRAWACLAKNDVEEAVLRLRKAVEIAPQFVEAWNQLGTIAYTSGRYSEAEGCFTKALERDPEAYEPLVNLGGTLLALDRLEESWTLNQKAVRMRPDDPLAHSQLGQSLYFLGRLDEAEAPLRQAKSLDPGHFTLPQLVLAAICQRRGDLAGAARELEEFLHHHPDSARAPRVRAELEAVRRRLAAAEVPPG
ncbi:MAG: tetratricopeptide repeat protein [Acidobacteria bacterium]|nr:tetratricopeptide repeat protein [Acidobacteriota bacterium]